MATVLLLLGGYLLLGMLFAVPFAFIGAQRIDPHAAGAGWGFRLLLIPGAVAFWPWLLHRWRTGVHEPPVERTAHREAARKGRP